MYALLLGRKSRHARKALAASSEDVNSFAEDLVRPAADGSVEASALYAAYGNWCAEFDVEPVPLETFLAEMSMLGYEAEDADGANVFAGIRVLDV